MIGTVLFVALFAIFAGLVRPEWVHRRRAFGWSVILVLTFILMYGVKWEVRLWRDFTVDTLLGAVTVLLGLALVATLMCALWPSGTLFSVGGKANSAEE
ncbi:MAG: hypothetical protein ACYTGV_09730 [Planctomycetota bacterium]|jgi:hypothetical protein